MEVSVEARTRSGTGKGAARRARAAGQVPAILYGRAIDAVPLVVDARDLSHALHTEAGANVLVNLIVDGRRYLTLVREVQRNPVRGDLLHVDFVNIARDVKIHADVPVHVFGESRGVKMGGVIEHHLWELKVEALPAAIPPAIEVDITNLGIGEHLRVSEVKPPPDSEILTDAEEIIVSVVAPQVLEVPAAAPEEEAAAEAAPEGEEAPEE